MFGVHDGFLSLCSNINSRGLSAHEKVFFGGVCVLLQSCLCRVMPHPAASWHRAAERGRGRGKGGEGERGREVGEREVGRWWENSPASAQRERKVIVEVWKDGFVSRYWTFHYYWGEDVSCFTYIEYKTAHTKLAYSLRQKVTEVGFVTIMVWSNLKSFGEKVDNSWEKKMLLLDV